MADQIRCPHCGQTYELTPAQVPQYAGQTITCTACKRAFTVPAMTTPPAPSPAAPYPPPQSAPYPPAHPMGYASAPNAAGYGPPPAPTHTSGLAIASLVLGCLGFVVPLVPALAGLVLGIMGLSKTKDPRVGGRGLAIAGISVSACSLLMTGCMISILLPSLNRARETANRVKCASNLRQIGQAELLYSNENRGVYSLDFPGILTTQDITPEVFNCPSSNDTPAPGATAQAQAQVLHQHCSYKYVAGQNNMTPANAVLAYEPLTNHNGDGANFLWGDGHVSWESKQTAASIIQQVEAGQNPPNLTGSGAPARRAGP